MNGPTEVPSRLNRSWSIAGTSAAIAVAGAMAAGCGSETPSPSAEASPTANKPAKEKPRTVLATSANGKTYSCPFTALGELTTAEERAKVAKRRVGAVERPLKKLDRRYPGGTAPAAVVDRYNGLLAEYKARIRTANRAVEAYNSLLRSKCAEKSGGGGRGFGVGRPGRRGR